MKKIQVVQITLLIVSAGFFTSLFLYTDTYNEIKAVIVDTTCFSCIKMNPVTHFTFTFNTLNNQPHPTYVQDNLTKIGPVFLAFRADVCAACDKMDPILKKVFNVEFGKKELFHQIIEYQGSNISFFHINIDHASGEFLDSFSTYDRDHRSGVPMFVMITLGNNSGKIQPYYMTAYGELTGTHNDKERIEYFDKMINKGIEFYQENIEEYIKQEESN